MISLTTSEHVTIGAVTWLVLVLAGAIWFGKFIRGTDDAARQLNEERRRQRQELDELSERRRRRPQR